MMWQVMLYAIGVAVAVSVMGYCEERLAFMREIPRRWVWPLTMALSIGLAASGLFWVGPAARATHELNSVTLVAPIPAALAQHDAIDAALASDTPAETPVKTAAAIATPSNRTLLLAWAAASTLLLTYFFAVDTLLRRRAARWQRAIVLGREVMVSDSIGPALLGHWRPRIVVPQWFMQESPQRQALILQHEEQHLAARDPLLLRAALLIVLAMPWNLPLWWQLKRLRQAIETDCDARVLRRGASPAAYGEILLSVARRTSRAPAGMVAMGAPMSTLERRIRCFTPDPARHSVTRATLALLAWTIGIGAAVALEAPPLPERSPDRRQPTLSVPPVAVSAAPEIAAAAEPATAPSTREADNLPRLLPPQDLGAVPSRREAIERAIVEHHPELVTGPERSGTAFVSLRLRQDSSVESSQMRFVEAGDTSELSSGNAPATEGRLLLAPGWQISGGATVKCQIVVRYVAAPGNRVSAGRLEYRSFDFEDAARVTEHYLPGAFSQTQRAAREMPWLILSRDGRVLRSGFLAPGVSPSTLLGKLPDTPLRELRLIGMSRGENSSMRTLALAWVEE